MPSITCCSVCAYVLPSPRLVLVHLPPRHAVRVVVRIQEELEGPHGKEERDVEPSPPCLGSCVEDWRTGGQPGEQAAVLKSEETRRAAEDFCL